MQNTHFRVKCRTYFNCDDSAELHVTTLSINRELRMENTIILYTEPIPLHGAAISEKLIFAQLITAMKLQIP